MRDASLIQLARGAHTTGYLVEILLDPRPCDAGIRHRAGAVDQLLEWSEIRVALVAEVGEPEGVRTVVFDLVVSEAGDPGGPSFGVRRLDAEPGEEAMALARTLADALGPRVASSVKSLALEGTPMSWYPDLEEFEAAALESLSKESRSK